MSTTMTYGAYEFSPVPFLTIRKEYQVAEDGQHLGVVFVITLDGTLSALPNYDGGITTVDTLQDELRTAFAEEGSRLLVACDGTTLLLAYPRVRSISLGRSNDNWVFTTPYTIELEFDDDDTDEDSFSEYISSANEEWLVEFLEDKEHYSWNPNGTADANPYMLRMTHNISAIGKRHYISGSGSGGTLEKEAWEQAVDWVVPRLGFDSTKLTGQGIININGADFTAFNHIRNKTINELGGSCAVTESWIVINPSGSGVAGNAIEDFSASVRRGIEDGRTYVTLEGTIKGLSEVTYGTGTGDYSVDTTSYENALDYWNTVQSRLLDRAKEVANGVADRDINSVPTDRSVSHSPPAGTVSYSRTYDDRSCNFISGSLLENIEVQDQNQADVFVSLLVLGRAVGPVVQGLGTVTPFKRNVSIECVMTPATGCSSKADLDVHMATKPTTQVNELLCWFYQEVSGSYSSVYKEADSESWNIKSGHYTRNVTWTAVNCVSGVAPDTGFC